MSVALPALAARAYSAKVDGVRLAVASLLSSDVPACVEGVLRDVASAGRQGSTLQVVRIVCLAARVSSVMQLAFTASFQHTAPSPEEERCPRRERAVLAGRTSSDNFRLAHLF